MLTERQRCVSEQLAERTGIDAVMISRLVRSFYGKVRQDELLGPVFDARIREWGSHLARMDAFWSSVALMTGIYHGGPMEKHQSLPIDARHFDRWLKLFRETAHEVCPPAAAAHFIDRAERIAHSLELGVASSHGILLRRGQRLHRSRE